ncbi:hypothetical protein FACS1894113_4110 [Alphaproteobacteria bacterium]|nr:hypothetical protein FACS1894113_4110 [Alphaproteobacteria bacterium]
MIAKTQISDLKTILDNLPNITFEIDNDIGVVSIVGSGIKTDQAILKDALALLNAKKIKLKQIAVSDMAISLVVPLQQTEILTNKLHKMFFEKG